MKNFDVAVIGAGTAGNEVALKCARNGNSVVLFENRDIGGTCLNRGCMPSKFYLLATSSLEIPETTDEEAQKITLPAILARKNNQTHTSREAITVNMEKAGVKIVRARAKFTGPGKIRSFGPEGEEDWSYKTCVLSVGSRPRIIPSMAPDGMSVLNSDEILELSELPKSLIIIGAGPIGLEIGQVFDRLGTSIILADMAPRPAATVDPEVGEALTEVLAARGWQLYMAAQVKSLLTDTGGQAKLTLAGEKGEKIIRAEKALVSTGRTPNSEDLGLEMVGISLNERGFVPTNDFLMAADNIYVAGDINGRLLLAVSALHQGAYIAKRIDALAKKSPEADIPYSAKDISFIIYGSPQTFCIGLMPKDISGPCEISRTSLVINLAPKFNASVEGLIKVAWLDGQVVGIAAVGTDVSKLSGLATNIVSQAWTMDQIREQVAPRSPVEEALKEALLAPRTTVQASGN